MGFGIVPPAVPVQGSLELLAPGFRRRVQAMLADPFLAGGPVEHPFETLRTEERQAFLYGFGREYDEDPPRGKVTKASTALLSWHGFSLALDLIDKAKHWNATEEFWENLALAAEKHGLAAGRRWKKMVNGILVSAPDNPHVQWGGCPVSPTEEDRKLFHTQGMQAVWVKYGAAA